MIINKDTKIFGSFSANPGNSGCKRFNNAFQKNNINAVYKSFKIENSDQNNILEAFRAAICLGFEGFAVSMPHKYDAALICDWVDDLAKETKSVNTVLLTEEGVKGFNLDYFGIKQFIGYLTTDLNNATIIGTGCFARTANKAMSDLNKVCRYLPRQNFEMSPSIISEIHNEIIFNATPAKNLSQYVNDDCLFIDCDPNSYTGKQMSFLTAEKQFRLYGFNAPYVFEEVD